MLIKIIYSNVLSYLVKMIYKIHERIVGRNMRDERTIKLLYGEESFFLNRVPEHFRKRAVQNNPPTKA